MVHVLQSLKWSEFDPANDCKSAGRLFGRLFAADNDTDSLAIHDVVEFARSCSPVSLDNVTAGDIINWALPDLGALVELGPQVRADCLHDACRNMEFEGNPDLAGIGVIVAFWIQASLISIFFVVYSYKAFRGTLPSHSDPSSSISAIAFDKTYSFFWSSCLYFGLGIAVASQLNVWPSVLEPKEATYHTLPFGSLAIVFSTTAVELLVGFQMRLAGHSRSDAWVAAAGFVARFAIVMVHTVIIAGTSTPSSTQQIKFDVACISPTPALRALSIGVLVGGWASIVLSGVLVNCWILGALSNSTNRFSMSMGVMIVVHVLQIALLWALLGLAMGLRSTVADAAGESYNENEWGFGQILAVMAWVPTVIYFIQESVREERRRRPTSAGNEDHAMQPIRSTSQTSSITSYAESETRTSRSTV